jgi:L-cysteine S-thiosulfotransferase
MAAALAVAAMAHAQDERQEIQRYQKMIAEGSPVELFELQGEALWKKPQGPRQASLEKCDLGQGPGVLKAAYARLPRYFADADRVMDLETRLLHCMTTLQGRTVQDATKRVFGNESNPSEMELLSAYIAGHSRGAKLAPGMRHAKEKEAIELGAGTFPARAATEKTASASACRTCPCSPSRSSRAR